MDKIKIIISISISISIFLLFNITCFASDIKDKNLKDSKDLKENKLSYKENKLNYKDIIFLNKVTYGIDNKLIEKFKSFNYNKEKYINNQLETNNNQLETNNQLEINNNQLETDNNQLETGNNQLETDNNCITKLDINYHTPEEMIKYNADTYTQINNLKKLDENDSRIKDFQKALNEYNNKYLNNEKDKLHFCAIYSDYQIQEKLLFFWFNHFNVYIHKGDVKFFIGDYLNTIRKNQLGNFFDLLKAIETHPAMINYLDNNINKIGKRNENLARELLELHTIGVGNYSQNDIIELSKILTGITYIKKEPYLTYNQKEHEIGSKYILDTNITAATIEKELDKTLQVIISNPKTAEHITKKMAIYFLGNPIPQKELDRFKEVFIKTNGNLKEVTKTILNSKNYENKVFKNNLEYMYGVSKIISINNNYSHLNNFLSGVSYNYFEKITPNGYSIEENDMNSEETMYKKLKLIRELSKQDINIFNINEQVNYIYDTKEIIKNGHSNNEIIDMLFLNNKFLYK